MTASRSPRSPSAPRETITIEDIADHSGTFTDTAFVSADQADPNTANNAATVTETVIAQSADLRLSISPVTPNPGLTGLPYSYTSPSPTPARRLPPTSSSRKTRTSQRTSSGHTDGKITEFSCQQDNISFSTLAVGATCDDRASKTSPTCPAPSPTPPPSRPIRPIPIPRTTPPP